nr:leucine-rich repeat domain-containing protein [Eubacterium sp.]
SATSSSSVTAGTYELVKGTDYTVAYADNTDPGTATVTLTGKGNYTGTATLSFTIEQSVLDIDSGEFTVELSKRVYTYTGSEITPSVIVTRTTDASTKALTEGTDYTVTYSNNINVGTGYATVTGTGGYDGSVVLTFSIVSDSSTSDGTETDDDGTDVVSNDINDAYIYYTDSWTYTGNDIEPEVIVKMATVGGGKRLLTEGTDYTVRYSNNRDVGTDAAIALTGAGDYEDSSATVYFEITQYTLNDSNTSIDPDTYTYTGSAITPTVVVTGAELTEGSDYSLSYYSDSGYSNLLDSESATLTTASTATDAGTYYVKVDGLDSNVGGSAKESFTIEPAQMSSCEVTLGDESKVYTGNPITPSVYVTFNGNMLTEGTDYTLIWSNNTEIGTATVKIVGKGNFTGTKESYFEITDGSSNYNSGDGTTPLQTNVLVVSVSSYVTVGTEAVSGYSTFEVTGSGTANYKSCGTSASGTVTIPSSIKITDANGNVSGPYKVTRISAGAFKNCKKVTKVVVNSIHLVSIGKNAFKNCTKLKTFNCKSRLLKSIGAKAFAKCSNLKTVKLKTNKITSVGSKAFKTINKKAVIKLSSKRYSAVKKLITKSGLKKGVKFKKTS